MEAVVPLQTNQKGRCIICGVFAFCSTNDKGPDLEVIRKLAIATEKRGPHAFGFAWIDDKNHIRAFKQTGRITDNLGLLSMLKNARMLIGHCRFSTHGKVGNINNHPHACDGGWVMHNGVIYDYKLSIKVNGLHPVSDCDSEVLGLLMERMEGPYDKRAAKAVLSLDQNPLVMLGLWKNPNQIVAVRQGNPLHYGWKKGGWYLASLATDLPGAKMIADNVVTNFDKSGKVTHFPLDRKETDFELAFRLEREQERKEKKGAKRKARKEERAVRLKGNAERKWGADLFPTQGASRISGVHGLASWIDGKGQRHFLDDAE